MDVRELSASSCEAAEASLPQEPFQTAPQAGWQQQLLGALGIREQMESRPRHQGAPTHQVFLSSRKCFAQPGLQALPTIFTSKAALLLHKGRAHSWLLHLLHSLTCKFTSHTSVAVSPQRAPRATLQDRACPLVSMRCRCPGSSSQPHRGAHREQLLQSWVMSPAAKVPGRAVA